MAAPPAKSPDRKSDNLKAAYMGLKPLLQRGAPFHPSKDIPSQAGKVILVTGGAAGIGAASVRELARHGPPAQIWVADLRAELAAPVIADVKRDSPQADVRFLELDLGSFDAVHRAAAKFLSETQRLDVLINNAGVLTNAARTTAEGYEVMFGVNFVGHALLTRLLLPRLRETASTARSPTDVRVVAVASAGHGMAPKDGGILFDTLRDPTCNNMSTYGRYGQSKLAVLLWMRRLARETPQLTVVAVHPGNVITGLATAFINEKAPFMKRLGPDSTLGKMFKFPGTKTPEQGCANQLWAATAEGVVSGKYYTPIGVPDRELGLAARRSEADVLEGRLWEWLEAEFAAADKKG